jgi:hypothetical protein
VLFFKGLKRQIKHLATITMTKLACKLLERLNETRQEVQIRFMRMVRSATFYAGSSLSKRDGA